MNLQQLQQQSFTRCKEQFAYIDEICLYNTDKIAKAYRECRVSEFHFHPSTGYGYGDAGREKLDEVFAHVFKAERGLVRPHFVSGTHTLATVLMAFLGKGDTMVSLIGAPYDTMKSVIGYEYEVKNSLVQKGVHYDEVPLKNDTYDLEGIKEKVKPGTKLVLIQRSRGYSSRKTLSPQDIGLICRTVKAIDRNIICFVDNCYGEFTAKEEPIEVGADITAGSLIKNAGAGLAPTGGYVVGKADLIETVADTLTAPGLGDHVGSYTGGYRLFFQGLFMAPHVVAQAVKGAVFAGAVFEEMGFAVSPTCEERRYDLIQSIYLKNAKNMQLFCEGLQRYSPVDAYVRPEPGEMPGYTDPIIMAGGTFVQGSSIELSADGPVREPYLIYLQGGIVFEHNMLAVMSAAEFVATHQDEE